MASTPINAAVTAYIRTYIYIYIYITDKTVYFGKIIKLNK